ncbi:MAG: 3-deoxy-manno-octulosonate cytidylyltransferase [Gammaproteobacteria bacterium]|nr:3-deoxy-manno-octulosonate cytidylyltransferase [Gammaproteobacteria bacterium]
MSRSLIIIPARLAAIRLPGKLLLDIAGKTMLQHCWELAVSADIGEVHIATEDDAIEQAALGFGASVLRTATHTSGTARIAAAVGELQLADSDLVINLQGDEPLLPVALIRQLHDFARRDLERTATKPAAAFSVCTPLQEHAQLLDPNQVKVVLDHAQRALLFTRAAIPWVATPESTATAHASAATQRIIEQEVVYLHHGLYAYPAATLRQWHTLPPGRLEQLESLEQLRLLENGRAIAMLVSTMDAVTLTRLRGVDSAADLQRVRALMSEFMPSSPHRTGQH